MKKCKLTIIAASCMLALGSIQAQAVEPPPVDGITITVIPDLPAPTATVELPEISLPGVAEIEVERPEGVEKPETEVEKPEVEKPETEIEKPEVEVEKPEVEVEKPEVEIEKPEVEIEKPEVEIEKPEVEIEKPEVEIEKPEVEVEKPE